MLSPWEDVLRADAEEVARRTLRHKFGRLSNRRILATVKAAISGPSQELADHELLERWFQEYRTALLRLRGLDGKTTV